MKKTNFLSLLLLLVPAIKCMEQDPENISKSHSSDNSVSFKIIKTYPKLVGCVGYMQNTNKVLTGNTNVVGIYDVNGNYLDSFNTGIANIDNELVTSDNNLAVYGSSKFIELWDVNKKQIISTSNTLSDMPMCVTEFKSPNILFIASQAGDMCIWDPRQKDFVKTWAGSVDGWTFNANVVPKCIYKGDEYTIITSHLFDACWWLDARGCPVSVNKLPFAQYGQTTATDKYYYVPTNDDNRIVKYNNINGEKIGHYQARSESLGAFMVVQAQDNKHILSGYGDGTFYMWDEESNTTDVPTLHSQPNNSVTSNIIVFPGNYILTTHGYRDEKTPSMRLFNFNIDSKDVFEIATANLNSPVTEIVMTAQNQLATVSYDGTLNFWEIDGLSNQNQTDNKLEVSKIKPQKSSFLKTKLLYDKLKEQKEKKEIGQIQHNSDVESSNTSTQPENTNNTNNKSYNCNMQ